MTGDEAIKAYLEREAFLRRHVAFMAGFGPDKPGDGIKIFNEIMQTEITDADRDRILEIIDEHVLRLCQLKELCIKLKHLRDRSQE